MEGRELCEMKDEKQMIGTRAQFETHQSDHSDFVDTKKLGRVSSRLFRHTLN